MDIKSLRLRGRPGPCLALALVASLCAAGCERAADAQHPLLTSPATPPAALRHELERGRLAHGPMRELRFVPADAEVLVRVDLRALAASDAGASRMLDFMLQAQQPTAWRFLSDAGLRAGRELAALYLVVGPRAQDGQALLLAGVGDIDADRARATFEAAGGVATPGPLGTTLFIWPHDVIASRLGSTLAEQEAERFVEESAIGVAPGLLLIGPPPLVRRALAVRAGEGKSVHDGALVDALLALDGHAPTWVVARAGERGVIDDFAPGLLEGRLALDLQRVGEAQIQIEARFADDAQATAFAAGLRELARLAATQAGKTPVATALARLEGAAAIHVSGQIVSVGAAL